MHLTISEILWIGGIINPLGTAMLDLISILAAVITVSTLVTVYALLLSERVQ